MDGEGGVGRSGQGGAGAGQGRAHVGPTVPPVFGGLAMPHLYDLSQVTEGQHPQWEVDNTYPARCNGNGTSPVGFLFKPTNYSLVMRKTSDKPKLRDILQATRPALLTTVKVIKTRTKLTE